MDNFILQYIYRHRYLVVIDGDEYVYKYEKYKIDQALLSFQPKHIFFGRSKACEMTEISEATDRSDFNGSTVLPEGADYEYVYISGRENIKFKTDSKIRDYKSFMGNNKTPYTFAIGANYTYFISTLHKFIENDKIEEGVLLNATINSLDPFNYHLGKRSVDSFETLEHTQIYTCWPGVEECEEDEDNEDVGETEDMIETIHCDGNNEVV